MSACIRTPLKVVREALVMTWKGLDTSGMQMTGVDRNISVSLTNTSSCFLLHKKGVPFLVKSCRGWARAEKLGMNFQ